jgi:hypothetical protein
MDNGGVGLSGYMGAQRKGERYNGIRGEGALRQLALALDQLRHGRLPQLG